MLFIVIHQTKELWLKQMLHEVGLACALVREDQFAEAYKALSRVSRIQAVMTLSWDVLATLTPVDYTRLPRRARHLVGLPVGAVPRARVRLGHQGPEVPRISRRRQRGPRPADAALAEPSLWDEANAALARAGFDIDGERARSRRPGSKSIATPNAGSSSTSWPRSWSTSTMRSPPGGTSMC